MTYIILDGTLPVINYKATVHLHRIKEGEKTYFTWKGQFNVPEGIDGNFMSEEISKNVYRGGILGVKKILEI